ncbi:endospore germination permease [Bacillus sp. FJAT-49736]|uniref:GerAB/ArcD/ProY family transporter n=1 Tax=Bacillus sp. FJAT-49736 TaxID=2833582 RepID=UPI001BC94824|nr:endospore germination permease [Bacillus sp. FJAT-49736]MBS4174322.1 endospore germination permease [Bacillus sp. FJAT-49736]
MSAKKINISASQMGLLMYPSVIATGIINLPLITGQVAKQDAWISPIWGSFIGVIAVWIAYQLNKSFPDKSFIQYSEVVVGKFIGKIIGFLYLFFLLHINGFVVREYTQFVWGSFLNDTPMIIISAIMIIFSAYAIYGGLEVIARLGQILFPFFFFPLCLLLFILLIFMHPKNILPIMERGILPSIKGGIVLSSWYSELFLISFFLPYIKEKSKGLKWGIYTGILITFTFMFVNLVTIFVLGRFSFYAVTPLLTVVRYISLGEFFQHVEAGLLAIWLIGTFIKITTLYYIVIKVASQWLNLPDEKTLIFPLGFLLLISSIWASKSVQQVASFILHYLPMYHFTFFIGIPFLILIINSVKNKVLKGKQSSG